MTQAERRIWQLIDKKEKTGLTATEQLELQNLQDEWNELHTIGYMNQNLSCFL